jgi:hypothetical protein
MNGTTRWKMDKCIAEGPKLLFGWRTPTNIHEEKKKYEKKKKNRRGGGW